MYIIDSATRDFFDDIFKSWRSKGGLIKFSAILIVIFAFAIKCILAARSVSKTKGASKRLRTNGIPAAIEPSTKAKPAIKRLGSSYIPNAVEMSTKDKIKWIVLISCSVAIFIAVCIYNYINTASMRELNYNRLAFTHNFDSCSAPTARIHLGKLPPDKIAIIETTKEGNQSYKIYVTNVQLVDGKEIKPHTCKITLLPGRHQLVINVEYARLEASFLFLMAVTGIKEPYTLTIRAEAGHVYKVYGGSYRDPLWHKHYNKLSLASAVTGEITRYPFIWVFDEQSDAVVAVAGTKQE